MAARFNIEQIQHKVPKESTSLFDLLAMLIIGGIGMYISLLGLEANDPISYGLGIAIMLVVFVFGVIKCLTAVRNFIWEWQDRLKDKNK